MEFFVDVILPIPLERMFTYKLSEEEVKSLEIGMRVAVPFGKTKHYAGLTYAIHHTPPRFYEAKSIHSILDKKPMVTPVQLQHWLWIADYYMCSIGEVFKAAVPGAFLLSSETMVYTYDTLVADEALLAKDEAEIYALLQGKKMLKVSELSKMINKKNILPLLERLLEKKLIRTEEVLTEHYTPKQVKHIRLHPRFASDEALHELLNQLERAPKQREVILQLFTLMASHQHVKTKMLQESAKTSRNIIRALLDKTVVEEYNIQTDRIQYSGLETVASKDLSKAQQIALQEVKEAFRQHQVVLLHGVTSSGKTEIYVKLIQEYINLNPKKQVLYLLPEIAITQQLIARLQQYFGEKVGVYHSRYSANERAELWNHCRDATPKAQIIVGTRSALFIAFSALSLIIVDEEHETSFKQTDPAPRYHARDSAIVLAELHKASVLLGSATPAIESYYNAKTAKFGMVKLKERYGSVMLPEVSLINLKEKYRKKKMKGHFSDDLLKAIQDALAAKEQVILFQNRRGYAPILSCRVCGHAPQCENCDVSLTYHKYNNQLRCHYCGYHMALQEACLACGSHDIDTKGFGTEQIESELKHLFPEYTIGRMDLDTTRGKFGYEKIINAFEQQEIHIMVGTQMLTKGLDFNNVSLVGIMNADSLLNFPDFRAAERSFQLMIQVAGRSGRRTTKGQVMIQTYTPEHSILQQVLKHDYIGMYNDQLKERRQYNYPPFCRLIKITLKHKDYNKINESADWLARSLKNTFGNHILGPEFPAVSRIKNKYIKNILVKIPEEQSIHKTKQIIKRIANSFNAIGAYRSVRLTFNVDNY